MATPLSVIFYGVCTFIFAEIKLSFVSLLTMADKEKLLEVLNDTTKVAGFKVSRYI